ncbi:WhiB family transcriptional regulator (plasmid) [Streptomyces sp. NA02950]|uniref:WhiB family transcriptional regulator n=1 Tax=Streptomyces sp. NA02950 TaxID=2742137 RepID=UPI00159225D1|nr:WhiB family transcriptional regulator [Streptomyces sp. NA02950]QKV98192.1 WhiB family transcriptional regulator [Streptomyces sp. NA02950]
MLSPDQNAALSELEAHPNWPLRLCAVTDELGEFVIDPDLFYTPGAANERDAKKVCLSGCPVLAACRAYALGGSGWWESDGVWGGMTADERRAERRAQKKRRARLARQGDKRPQPTENWEPSPAQASLLQALAEQPDLRAAAETMKRPYPNVRWVYAQMCEQLGFHSDELTVPALLEEAAKRISGERPSGPELEAAA